ncbi:gonadotropin-releasing hormone receptor [Dermacentor silvarum]|uniref:gonadotropin-releasing hormone receptor n=1 Tax=Dermacentor silvarum TaxID=543639 RepID=UPI0021019C05|nr:gonadotropin-releasing hormone receptor [Dermacentor silvarum]
MSPNESFEGGDPHSGENASAASLALGEELTFSTQSLVQVIIYCILFVIAGAGNVPVFVSLLNKRHRKSRIKLMILHLAFADLIVTFVMIPLEVAWRLTVQWAAGNVMCKLMQMLRAFGPYLSSMVLVCISVDRYYAVLHPLKVHSGHRRGRIMLTVAWYASLVCSIPQAAENTKQTQPPPQATLGNTPGVKVSKLPHSAAAFSKEPPSPESTRHTTTKKKGQGQPRAIPGNSLPSDRAPSGTTGPAVAPQKQAGPEDCHQYPACGSSLNRER